VLAVASSPAAPPQATAEPHGEPGGASVENVFRSGENPAQVRRCEKKSVRNSPVSTWVREGGGGAPGTRAGIPLQPLRNPRWSRCSLRDCTPGGSFLTKQLYFNGQ